MKENLLGKLLAEFDSKWEPAEQKDYEIIWTLRLDGESEQENFSLKKLQDFKEYIKKEGYSTDIGQDELISVTQPQRITTQSNYSLYIKKFILENKEYA